MHEVGQYLFLEAASGDVANLINGMHASCWCMRSLLRSQLDIVLFQDLSHKGGSFGKANGTRLLLSVSWCALTLSIP